jgi:steroid delta-isomerase-like uncharacterized protein
MTADENADLVRRLYAAINANDHAARERMLAPDMVRHDLAGMLGEEGSREGVSNFLDRLREAMPDLHMEVEDVIATDDDRAAARATLTGTHQGEFLGAAPTGRRVSFAAITLYRIVDGRIAEAWSLVDWAGALRQMQRS